MRKHKYVFDFTDLQYKRVKLPLGRKFLHGLLWLAGTVIIALVYGVVFQSIFGSPKEASLKQEIENMKLQYSLLGRQVDNSLLTLDKLKQADDNRYRPVLDMDTLSASYRKPGFGGVDRFSDIKGYSSSDMIIAYRTKVEELKIKAEVQNESFRAVTERTAEWKREMDHLPIIYPVDVKFGLGEGLKWRKVHPVLGTAQMHNGQDIHVPSGTRVYATGDGKVITSGWISGFGNCVVIDHGYGLQTTYGHLSQIRAVVGMNVKRGDLIALSGNTGISTGPHLHYQIEKFGKHVNPINYFNNDLSVEEYNVMIQTLESESKFR